MIKPFCLLLLFPLLAFGQQGTSVRALNGIGTNLTAIVPIVSNGTNAFRVMSVDGFTMFDVNTNYLATVASNLVINPQGNLFILGEVPGNPGIGALWMYTTAPGTTNYSLSKLLGTLLLNGDDAISLTLSNSVFALIQRTMITLKTNTFVGGYVNATNGYGNNGINFTLLPTNNGIAGDAILVTSVVGNTMTTKYGNASTNSPKTNTIASFTIYGAVATGAVGVFPVAGDSYTISGWSITAVGTAPTCTIDVWKIATGGTALPTVANTIMGTKPALAAGNKITSTTLTAWNTTVAKNDTWGFNIDAASGITNLTFQIYGFR
jgi:hypothetical protein